MAYTIMDNDKGERVVSHEPEGYIKSCSIKSSL
jgi:hypothetical protein